LAIASSKFEPVGSVPISVQGQVTIPKSAREACGLGEGERVYVWFARDPGQILLTHEPPAEDLVEAAARLIDAAAKAARSKRSGKT
jgi:AbrB family looped-hinge helix DNA binding protein